jgi:glutathionyl-hydroquinone reductase
MARYHLYVSYACPWASRCLAFLSLKGLQDAIPVHTVAPVPPSTQLTRAELSRTAAVCVPNAIRTRSLTALGRRR